MDVWKLAVTGIGPAVVTGAVIALGLVLVVRGLRPGAPVLADALARLDVQAGPPPQAQVPARNRSERLGQWLHLRGAVPVTAAQRRLLELQGKPLSEFAADKLIMALLGLITPVVVLGVFSFVVGVPPALPAGVGLVGAVAGWFAPDLLLRRGAEAGRSAAGEALFLYFDLIVLERMANLSAAQSLESAANLSDAPLFTQLRGALTRARLQQQAPWNEIRRLADRLQLPELADVADVMSLDETGATLNDALRARVRELRDSHLTATRIAAHEVSERMTIYMVIPAMIFGLIFLTPPMLRLMGVA